MASMKARRALEAEGGFSSLIGDMRQPLGFCVSISAALKRSRAQETGALTGVRRLRKARLVVVRAAEVRNWRRVVGILGSGVTGDCNAQREGSDIGKGFVWAGSPCHVCS